MSHCDARDVLMRHCDARDVLMCQCDARDVLMSHCDARDVLICCWCGCCVHCGDLGSMPEYSAQK